MSNLLNPSCPRKKALQSSTFRFDEKPLLSQDLVYIREERGWTQHQLAFQYALALVTVVNWENGRYPKSFEILHHCTNFGSQVAPTVHACLHNFLKVCQKSRPFTISDMAALYKVSPVYLYQLFRAPPSRTLKIFHRILLENPRSVPQEPDYFWPYS